MSKEDDERKILQDALRQLLVLDADIADSRKRLDKLELSTHELIVNVKDALNGGVS